MSAYMNMYLPRNEGTDRWSAACHRNAVRPSSTIYDNMVRDNIGVDKHQYITEGGPVV